MLNEEQEEIINYPESSLIIAGAGSGKTHTLVHKIRSLVYDRNIDPDGVLALTFTKKAAKEMDDRLDGAVDNVYNFHSLCLDLMMLAGKHNPELMEPFKKGFSILDDYEQTSILSRAIKEHQNFKALDGSVEFYTVTGKTINRGSLKEFSGRLQNLKDNSTSELITLAPWTPAEKYLAESYSNYQVKHNAIDFSDMIRLGIQVCNGLGDLGFSHIFVDELQDTNKNQFLFLEALYRGSNKPIMFGVGDIDQAIYEWRSAKPDNVFLFQEMFDAKMFKLVQNYRSKASIVLTANALIENNKKRIDKVMVPVDQEAGSFKQIFPSSDKEEALYFADEICILKEGETASVLMRTNRQLNGVEAILRSRGVNFTIRKDASMMNRADVKSVNEILNLALHPRNPNSIFRVLSLLEGFGEKAINDVIRNNGNPSKLTPRTEKSWNKLQDVLYSIREYDRENNPVGIMSLFEFTDGGREYTTDENMGAGLSLLSKLYNKDKPEEITMGMERVSLYTEALDNFSSIQNFLYGMSLDTGNDNSANDGEEANIYLQTIHGSKGLEFDHVFIGGVVENHYPEADEEARRLLYVAMTRAKSRLVMSAPSFVMGQTLVPSKMMDEASLENIEFEDANLSIA